MGAIADKLSTSLSLSLSLFDPWYHTRSDWIRFLSKLIFPRQVFYQNFAKCSTFPGNFLGKSSLRVRRSVQKCLWKRAINEHANLVRPMSNCLIWCLIGSDYGQRDDWIEKSKWKSIDDFQLIWVLECFHFSMLTSSTSDKQAGKKLMKMM